MPVNSASDSLDSDNVDNIAGILLAAGQSSRFGSQKLLHSLPGSNTPIVIQSALNLLRALPFSVVVVRANDRNMISLMSSIPIHIVENHQADKGISSSIKCAIQTLDRQLDDEGIELSGWVMALADMPKIPVQVIDSVASQIRAGALISAPVYHQTRGHPVGFSTQLKSELLELEGDIGARQIITRHKQALSSIEVDSPFVLEDVDVPEDLHKFVD